MSRSHAGPTDPTMILLAWALIGFGLGRLFPIEFVPDSLDRPLVVSTLLPGVLLWAWSAIELRRHRTSLDHAQAPTALVTTGPFRYSRNPIYVGLTLLMIGFSIDYESLWALLLIVPAVVALQRQTIAREESQLEEKFGQPYLDYKASVRRWL